MEEFAAALQDPGAHLQAYSPLPGYKPATQSYAVVGSPGREPTGQVPVGPTTQMGQRPTTLSGAAGEVADAPKKSRMPLLAALGAVVLIGGVGGVLALKGGKAPPPSAAIQPKDESVKLTINSTPPGAKVFRADTGKTEDGQTPLTITLKKGAPAFDIQVKLDGYKAGLRNVQTDHDAALLVPLDKEAAPPTPAPVAAAAPPPAPAPAADEKKKDRHHSSSSSTPKPAKPKKGEEGGDDMKLLQPQF
jgi:hypothetical protein